MALSNWGAASIAALLFLLSLGAWARSKNPGLFGCMAFAVVIFLLAVGAALGIVHFPKLFH
jgi:hypothetical protein